MDGDYQPARRLIGSILPIVRKVGHKFHISSCLVDLARIDIREGRVESARKRLDEAVQLNNETGSLEDMDAVESLLAEIESLKGNQERTRM